MNSESTRITQLLNSWSQGDSSALEQLSVTVYSELHRLARRNLARERGGHLLQPSALVNEAFVRLIGGAPVEWSSRAHFFAVSARHMRQILIDFARAQETNKRGHRAPHIQISEVLGAASGRNEAAHPVDLIDLDVALQELSSLDARQAQVVELRYFGGLENSEIAAVLSISEPTVVRDWRVARAWLYSRLAPAAS